MDIPPKTDAREDLCKIIPRMAKNDDLLRATADDSKQAPDVCVTFPGLRFVVAYDRYVVGPTRSDGSCEAMPILLYLCEVPRSDSCWRCPLHVLVVLGGGLL